MTLLDALRGVGSSPKGRAHIKSMTTIVILNVIVWPWAVALDCVSRFLAVFALGLLVLWMASVLHVAALLDLLNYHETRVHS